MRMEQRFHPLGGGALRQVLVRKFVHRGNEGLNVRDGLEAVMVRLALVVSGVCVQQGQQ